MYTYYSGQINTLRPGRKYHSYICVSYWTRPALVQLMACRLFGTKPSLKLMLIYCISWAPRNKRLWYLIPNTKFSFSVKFIWNCCLKKCEPFCSNLNISNLFQEGGIGLLFHVCRQPALHSAHAAALRCVATICCVKESVLEVQKVRSSHDDVMTSHDEVMAWKFFLHYWPFVRESQRASNAEL